LVSRVVAVGERTQPIDSGARQEGPGAVESTWVPDVDAAYELLRQQLAPGDVVLVKSSRDAGLRWLGERLVDDIGPEVTA
jgi:UDP-N-acetylmuramoyl-tripeptide--D-alanyl-D-alanine ligase